MARSWSPVATFRPRTTFRSRVPPRAAFSSSIARGGSRADEDEEAPCHLDTTTTDSDVRCAAEHVRRVVVDLGGGDDKLETTRLVYRDAVIAAGGPGHDTLIGGAGRDEFRGGPGDDPMIAGNGGDDYLAGRDGVETLVGGTGAETVISGGSGDDTIVDGADTISGGVGTDTVDFSQRTQRLTVTLDGQWNDGEAGEGDNVQTDVEGVIGGSDDDDADRVGRGQPPRRP